MQVPVKYILHVFIFSKLKYFRAIKFLKCLNCITVRGTVWIYRECNMNCGPIKLFLFYLQNTKHHCAYFTFLYLKKYNTTKVLHYASFPFDGNFNRYYFIHENNLKKLFFVVDLLVAIKKLRHSFSPSNNFYQLVFCVFQKYKIHFHDNILNALNLLDLYFQKQNFFLAKIK